MRVVSTFFGRHPRYTLGLVIVIALCTLYLIPSETLSLPSFLHSESADIAYPSSDKAGCSSTWLSDTLKAQEHDYQVLVQKRRADLIKKYGPTVDGIVSFPTVDREFYTLWDFFIPAFKCPHRIERIGSLGDGGTESRSKRRLNGEVSFEAELLSRAPSCRVWGYDYSVNSFGPEVENGVDVNDEPIFPRSHFRAIAVGGRDAHDKSPAVYSLQTLMKVNDHSFIDILKVDVEASEFATLEAFIDPYRKSGEPLPFGQLQLEIHVFPDDKRNEFTAFRSWWEKLEAAGLRPFFTEPNLVYLNLYRGARPDIAEYSFINIRGEHVLVSDRWLLQDEKDQR